MNIAIGKGIRRSRPIVVSGPLRDEITHWLFLESWDGYVPWRKDIHYQLILCTGASSFGWGCVFSPDSKAIVSRDYWPSGHQALHINVKEALALVNALEAYSSSLRDAWVDVYSDSFTLIQSWERQGSNSHLLVDAMKRIFAIAFKFNMHLNFHYIQSSLNPADSPSRVLSLQDATLSPSAWSRVQTVFGGPFGHSVDLMALPSNAQCALDGSTLPFFSPFPIPGSSGVNMFAQHPHRGSQLFSNPYVFPPIILIPHVLSFIQGLSVPCTFVIPDIRPRKFWWPLFQSLRSFLLAPKGSSRVVLSPSERGFSPSWCLPWDLWVFRFQP